MSENLKKPVYFQDKKPYNPYSLKKNPYNPYNNPYNINRLIVLSLFFLVYILRFHLLEDQQEKRKQKIAHFQKVVSEFLKKSSRIVCFSLSSLSR